MYKQKTRWSVFSMIMTLLVVIFFLGAGAYMVRTGEPLFITALLWGLLIVMCLTSMCFYPMEIQVGEGKLNIAFPFRNKSIPLDEIAKAEPYQITMNFVRVCGSGSFFGWWGWFRNQELGKFMVYASELKNLFYIELKNGKKYVISCSDSEALCQAILQHSKHIDDAATESTNQADKA